MRTGDCFTLLALSLALAACEAAAPTPAEPIPSAREAKPATTADPGIAAGMAALERGDANAAALAFRPLAAKGDAEAQYRLALLQADGKGVAKDVAGAVELLRQAAAQRHVDAQGALGYLLMDEGAALAKTPREGMDWLVRSAEGGSLNSMAVLTLLYRNDARYRDLAQARHWEQKLAEQDLGYVPGPPQSAEQVTADQRLTEIDSKLAATDARLAEIHRRQRALAVQRRELTLEARRSMPKLVRTLAKFRDFRQRQMALIDRTTQAGYPDASMQALLQRSNESIRQMEAEAPDLLGPRLLSGELALMGPQGSYVLLGSTSTKGLDASTLPRAGDRVLSRRQEGLLTEYEHTWSGVEEDEPAAQRSLASLNRLLGEYSCDTDFFGLRFSTRDSALEGPDVTLDEGRILRLRSRLGDSHKNAWSERVEFIPLAHIARIEVIPGRKGECATLIARCHVNRYCALSTGGDLSSSGAVTLHFPLREDAEQAADQLRSLLPSGAAAGDR